MGEDWLSESLNNLRFLARQSFVRKRYEPHLPDCNHDHCAVCGMTFAGVDMHGVDVIHEGYTCAPKSQHGAGGEWVCVECFEAAKGIMGWQESTATP